MRDTMLFFRSFYDSAQKMTGEDRLAFYDAILGYTLYNEQPSALSDIPSVVFTAILPVLDGSIRSHDVRNARAEGGKKGGRPRTENLTENLTENPKDMYMDKEMDKEGNVFVSPALAREDAADALQRNKDIFIKFYFKNFIDPTKETRRYLAWGRSTGWVSQSGRTIKDPVAYAAFWKPETEGQRFPAQLFSIVKKAYTSTKSEAIRNCLLTVHAIQAVGNRITFRTAYHENGVQEALQAAAGNDYEVTHRP